MSQRTLRDRLASAVRSNTVAQMSRSIIEATSSCQAGRYVYIYYVCQEMYAVTSFASLFHDRRAKLRESILKGVAE